MTNIKKGADAIKELYTEADEEREPLRVVIKLRQVLDERNMTQKELAELTGIRPNAISMIVRGYIERLNLDHIARIATALDISEINELIELMPESEARQYEY